MDSRKVRNYTTSGEALDLKYIKVNKSVGHLLSAKKHILRGNNTYKVLKIIYLLYIHFLVRKLIIETVVEILRIQKY